jgi:CheY-like chemotaxis protein
MKNILIVEDEAIIALDLKNYLIKYGYSIAGIVSSGDKAVKTALAEIPDLILMDINLKGDMNGVEANRIIQDKISIPVIFMSAFSEEYIANQFGLMDFCLINKPYKHYDLHKTIEAVLNEDKTEGKI